MKVSNMTSAKGNMVPNQFIIEDCFIETGKTYIFKGQMFQSYNSNIAFIPHNRHIASEDNTFDGSKTLYSAYLDKNKWDYSVTTGKYRNQFLNETKKETQKKIDSGEYKLVDLNR